MVHVLIQKTAKEIAGAYYEIAAGRDNQFYREWPNQNVFIRRNWKNFIMETRRILASMLGRAGYPEVLKNEIFEALMLDSELPFSTQENQIINVTH
jgi:hypothetical protein